MRIPVWCSRSACVLLGLWCVGPSHFVMVGCVIGISRGCRSSPGQDPCAVYPTVPVSSGSWVLPRCSLPFVLRSMCFVLWVFILAVGFSTFPRVRYVGRAVPVRGFASYVCSRGCGVPLSVCRSQRVPLRIWALPAMLWWVAACQFVCFFRCPVRRLVLPVCLFVIMGVRCRICCVCGICVVPPSCCMSAWSTVL